MHYVVSPDEREFVEEWASFQVTKHEVDVRYSGRWYCVTFSEYPDGDFGDGLAWDLDSTDKKKGPAVRLSQHQIGSIVDGMGDRCSST